MKKLSLNAPCPCGSGLKYKRCCRPFHRGKIAPDALTLMKSRYSAYAAGEVNYIIRTTHPEYPERNKDPHLWREEIVHFCRHERFEGLKIIETSLGERESFVIFLARLGSGPIKERSRFLHEDGRWLYHSGKLLSQEEK